VGKVRQKDSRLPEINYKSLAELGW
jgi:hypothetical protein